MVAATSTTGADAGSPLLLVGAIALIVVILVVAGLLARSGGSNDAVVTGEVIGAPLHMALRFLAQDQTTARVHVVSKAGAGQIHVMAGRIVHATAGLEATGDRAATQLLRWDPSVTTVTVVRDAPVPPERTVTMSLADLCRSAGVSN